MFPWFSPDQNVKREQTLGSPCKYKPELLEYLKESVIHDHKYSKTKTEESKSSVSSDDEWATIQITDCTTYNNSNKSAESI